ncbi:hypothetical protein DL95DRAFT_462183 [Leptodontidium sp. 2 PMI_412]|nr:hypothetical protein DL95DRAFT_462183 [Leptodontidium sp. 2 PMI_412]
MPNLGDQSSGSSFRAMTGIMYSEKKIRDLVIKAKDNAKAFPFSQEFGNKYNQGTSQAEYQSMTRGLLDILKFGDPREYLTPINSYIEPLESVANSNGAMRHISDLSSVSQSIKEEGSYATFPISNNLIVFARVLRGHEVIRNQTKRESQGAKSTSRTLPSRHIPELEIAELLLGFTRGTSDAIDMFSFSVIGRKMLDGYLQVLAKKRKVYAFTGWYKAKESNRKANYGKFVGGENEMARWIAQIGQTVDSTHGDIMQGGAGKNLGSVEVPTTPRENLEES